MVFTKIEKLSKKLKSKFIFNYDTSLLAWFKTGGKADIFCLVSDEEELEIILNEIGNMPIFVIGAGSNILIRDGGFRGMVIKLGKSFNYLSVNNNLIFAGASILDSNLSKFALFHSLSKLEFFSGIPGSVGGAVKMNAGCYGNETKDVLAEVSIITKEGIKKKLKNIELDFSYRNSNLSDNDIVTSAVFKTNLEEKEKIKLLIDEIKFKRENSQPIKNKTSGSTFKNPEGYFAAELIEKANCKGLGIGDAMVSLQHANFIINTNKALAKEIEDLGTIIKERVYKKFNIELKWEIKIIGDYTV